MATGMTPYEHEIKELQKLFQTEQARLTSLQRQIAECQFQLRYLQGKIDAYAEMRTKPPTMVPQIPLNPGPGIGHLHDIPPEHMEILKGKQISQEDSKGCYEP